MQLKEYENLLALEVKVVDAIRSGKKNEHKPVYSVFINPPIPQVFIPDPKIEEYEA